MNRHLKSSLLVLGFVLLLGTQGVSQAAIILNGTADLLCDIPEYGSGINVVSNVIGDGISFDGTTSPLINPELRILGTSLSYEFSAALDAPTPAVIGGGIGNGTIDSMSIDVFVMASKFTQPGGPGTMISIDAIDITPDSFEKMKGIFTRLTDGKTFAFEMTLSGFSSGSVILEPESADPVTGLERKRLEIFAANVSGQVRVVPEPCSGLLWVGVGICVLLKRQRLRGLARALRENQQ